MIHGAAEQALADPQVKHRMETLGTIGVGTNPGTFAFFIAGQRTLMARLVRENNIVAD